MHGLGATIHVQIKSKIFFSLAISCGLHILGYAAPTYAQTGSQIQAIICGSGSAIDVVSPPDGSTVDEGTVIVEGNVSQASQIEVRIDGEYDGSIPISATEQTYVAPVHLTAGMHTIALKAIDACSIADSEVELMVIYAPPPAVMSSGSGAGAVASGVTIGTPQEENAQQVPGVQNMPLLPMQESFSAALDWLNIASFDAREGAAPQLTMTRALVIAAGSYLALFSLAESIVDSLASQLPLGARSKKHKYRVVRRGVRVAGVFLCCLGLFL